MSFKPVSFEAIMALSEDAIAETFPLGIVAVSTDRWRPAEQGEEPNKELGELVKAKHDRQDHPRYLRQSYSIPSKYVRNPNAKSRDEENDNYTHSPHKAVQGPQGAELAMSRAVQEELSREAEQRFIDEQGRPYGMDAKRASQSLSERLKAVEERVHPSQLESLERRIKGLERSLHDKAA